MDKINVTNSPYLRELTRRRMCLDYHFCLSIGLPRVCDPDISRVARRPERHKYRYFTRSDFLKGTRYEELTTTTTFGSDISRACLPSFMCCVLHFFHFWRIGNLSGIEFRPRAEQIRAVYKVSKHVSNLFSFSWHPLFFRSSISAH